VRDAAGGTAEFNDKFEADRAIELFIGTRDRKEEWLFRLNVVHKAHNLRYRLGPIYRGATFFISLRFFFRWTIAFLNRTGSCSGRRTSG
jgi:hypothetical protein